MTATLSAEQWRMVRHALESEVAIVEIKAREAAVSMREGRLASPVFEQHVTKLAAILKQLPRAA